MQVGKVIYNFSDFEDKFSEFDFVSFQCRTCKQQNFTFTDCCPGETRKRERRNDVVDKLGLIRYKQANLLDEKEVGLDSMMISCDDS